MRLSAAERRTRILAAALDLVVEGGFQAVSLRRVAAAAELNIGSVRHVFASHEELLTAAAAEVGARMGRRLASQPAPGSRAELAALIAELLPLDEPRRAETIVIVELITAARTQPVFAAAAAQMAADLDAVLREALSGLGHPDPAAAAGVLAAVIGGLSLDAITPHGALSSVEIRRRLGTALEALVP